MNRLAVETSPYLQQHARNPVDWYPWGEQALQKAQHENKLILVSIGYAACHWCHVMERESFENEAVAQIMNEHFVCIKVDREERPDIDDIYMTACQLSSRRGCGWPLNAFALPDGRPIWAATYFPRDQWIQVLESFAVSQKKEYQKLEQYATQLTEDVRIQETLTQDVSTPTLWSQETLNIWHQSIMESRDPIRGGTKTPPKFPTSGVYDFLMDYNSRYPDKNTSQIVDTSLDRMAMGGLYDQVNGGFARYSVDADWKIPHFEKMLYDNGQLLHTYAQAYRLKAEPRYRRVVKQTVDFVRDEWTSPQGGFYASFDADSEGKEGTYYLWTKEQLKDLISKGFFDVFCDYYNITPAGNWEGSNILFADQKAEFIASKHGWSLSEFEIRMAESLLALKKARSRRPKPALDDKILTSWNALMLKGLISSYLALPDSETLDLIHNNLHFLSRRALRSDGGLYRDCKGEHSRIHGFLEDYAFLIDAFIQHYQMSLEHGSLSRAVQLTEYVLKNFGDTSSSMFFTTEKSESVVARKMVLLDSVTPSPNSVMAHNLYSLGILTHEPSYIHRAQQMMKNMQDYMKQYKQHHFFYNWCLLYLRLLQEPLEIVVTGPEAKNQIMQLHQHHWPHVLLSGATDYSEAIHIEKAKFVPNKTMFYVCTHGSCQAPTDSIQEALTQIESLTKR